MKRVKHINGDAIYRVAAVEVSNVSDEERTIDLVLMTESPVEVFDVQKGQIVEEVVRVDGLEMPKQVPLLDTHKRDSVRYVVGSIRNLRKEDRAEGPAIMGRAYFAADAESVRTHQAYRDGHLTDFSVGALRRAIQYEGDRRIVTKSKLVEGSTVVRGADPNAKALPATMRAYIDPHGAMEEAMLNELKTKLVERGLSADADEKETMAFVDTLLKRDPEPKGDDDLRRELEELKAQLVERAKKDAESEKAQAELARRKEIEELCRDGRVEDEVQRQYIQDGTSVEDVAKAILKRQATSHTDPVGPISFGPSDKEKFYFAARDSIALRAIQGAGLSPHKALERAKASGDFDSIHRSTALVETLEKPSQGTQDFRNVGMLDLARMFCERAGVRVTGLPTQELVKRALQLPSLIERASDGPAFHVTASFPNLLLDAANKTLLAAYDEAAVTYPSWVRTAPSAPDFKTLNRVRFGELSDPKIVPENDEYPETSASDNKESYRVEKYGQIFSISMEAIVNDDLNAISRIPAMQGNAMRRKINKVVYAILTSNPNLSDGIALFHATSHGANLDATALAEGALDTGFNVMMTQAGLDSGTILNIQPRFLIVPAGLSATAERLVTGGVVAATVANLPLYGSGRPRPLTVISEGQLDGTSTTGWYLAADPGQVDTIELSFLRGEESPVLEREAGFTTDSVKYKVRQSFAAKAIDFRGLYQGNS